jgi:hypothetical protein
MKPIIASLAILSAIVLVACDDSHDSTEIVNNNGPTNIEERVESDSGTDLTIEGENIQTVFAMNTDSDLPASPFDDIDIRGSNITTAIVINKTTPPPAGEIEAQPKPLP